MGDGRWGRENTYTVTIVERHWLSASAFTLRLSRPVDFNFLPGQKILLRAGGCAREYSIALADTKCLTLCIKHVAGGEMTEHPSTVENGESVSISEAYGYFLFRSGRPVFIATGTGVAPFAAYAESGVRDFVLLHGVSDEDDLYFRNILEPAAKLYVPCVSRPREGGGGSGCFRGRVTDYLEKRIPGETYDFYICGGGDMVTEVMDSIDRLFPESRIFTEKFYG